MTLGLKDLYYAVCTEADGAESYGTPKKMAEAMSADLSVKTADGSLYHFIQMIIVPVSEHSSF